MKLFFYLYMPVLILKHCIESIVAINNFLTECFMNSDIYHHKNSYSKNHER